MPRVYNVTQVRVVDGSSSTPSMSFVDGTGEGFFRTTSGEVAIASGTRIVSNATIAVRTDSARGFHFLPGSDLGQTADAILTRVAANTVGTALGGAATTSLASIGGVANLNTTAVGNVGTGTDDLITYSLPASALSANGKGVRITAWGTTANNANAKTVTLDFGTQTIETEALTTSQASVWLIQALVFRTGSNTQDILARLFQDGATQINDMTITAGTQTDTAAITIKCTGNATADNDIVQEGLLVEYFN